MDKVIAKTGLAMSWAIASVFGSQVVIGFLMILLFGNEYLSSTVGMLLYSALSYLVAVGLVVYVPRRTKRAELGLSGWPTWTDIGLSIVGFIAYLVLAYAFTNLFSLFPWFDIEEAQDVGFSPTVFGVDRILAFISLVIIAPIAEEVVFRGWLYGRLRAIISEKASEAVSIGVSAVLVSILFGIVHLQWNVGVNVFAMSLIMCGMREVTGTIYSGILLHMIKNGVAFYMLFVLGLG